MLKWLLHSGSIGQSLGVYVPATALQKAVGLVRLILLTYLTTQVEYNLWAAGAMIFDLAAPLVCLGSHNGLARYVAAVEARGELRAFARRTGWAVLVLSAAMTGVLAAGIDPLRVLAVASRHEAAETPVSVQTLICWAALANVLVLALYLNLTSFLYGLRTYRLASAVELFFALLFTGASLAVLAVWPSGLAVLLTHAACVAVTLVAALAVLHVGFSCGLVGSPGAAPAGVMLGDAAADELASAPVLPAQPVPLAGEATFGRVIWFGLAALAGNLAWNLAAYVSYRLTSWHLGGDAGAEFQAMLRINQTVMFLSTAAWGVVFAHVVGRWEQGRRAEAFDLLRSTSKAMVLATMTVSVAIYSTAPLWVRVLPARYHSGVALAGGLAMFFQALMNLSTMDVLARLRERPLVTAAALACGMAANAGLALWWIPCDGPVGAARAAGVGMLVGTGAIMAIYLLAARQKLDAGAYFLLASAGILLLPSPMAAAVWAAVLVSSALAGWPLNRKDKAQVLEILGRKG